MTRTSALAEKRVTRSCELQTNFTLADMERFAVEAWGDLGMKAVKKWAELNAAYFDNRLLPIPLIITQTLPYGKSIGDCSSGEHVIGGRMIRLNIPHCHDRLVADNNTLLHEMIHQYLFERGENASHKSEGWRREIMRLNKFIAGQKIWAGRSKTVRRDKKVVRVNETGT